MALNVEKIHLYKGNQMEQLYLYNEYSDMDYDISLIVALFLNPIKTTDHKPHDTCMAIFKRDKGLEMVLYIHKKPYASAWVLGEDITKNTVKKTVYETMSKAFQSMSPWGILVGIRPVKIVHELLDQNLPIEALKPLLVEQYVLREDKAELCMEVALKERPYLYPLDEDAISLYLCVPFCPTRCSYCSFPSNDLHKKGHLIETYLDFLIKEFHAAMDEIQYAGKHVDCIYVGGGTPTVLRSDQLTKLLTGLESRLDLKHLKEFTIEAGRPDTIDRDKLCVMKAFHVSRICVNPQSMNTHTLHRIGRTHDPDDIRRAMALAKEVGFDSINMDLIVGLPEEGSEQVEKTIEKMIALDPDNITVHTLAIKKASKLMEAHYHAAKAQEEAIEGILATTDQTLRAHAYAPYYMYRQKNMLGHQENIGYSKAGKESLYNMRIMEERHTIVALGAGSVSKICYPKENRHERVANLKGLEEYMDRFNDILDKKKFWRH